MENEILTESINEDYKYGFVTDIEADNAPKGLSEDIVRFISKKKNEPQWLLDYRLKAYKHFMTLEEPAWPHLHYPKVDFQAIRYYSAPKKADEASDKPKSLDDLDPELLKTFEKLGNPLIPGSKSKLVVKEGLFRFTRNPMYLGFIIFLLG